MIEFTLRPWQPEDARSAAEFATDRISRNMSDAFPGNCVEKWEKFVKFATENPNAIYRAIEIEGQVAGGIGVLLKDDMLRQNAELGYWIGEMYWGQGIITKAIVEMVNMVFEQSDVIRIYATPFGTNYASQRVLEKAGFTLEGIFEKVYLKNGIMRDELVYAIRR